MGTTSSEGIAGMPRWVSNGAKRDVGVQQHTWPSPVGEGSYFYSGPETRRELQRLSGVDIAFLPDYYEDGPAAYLSVKRSVKVT